MCAVVHIVRVLSASQSLRSPGVKKHLLSSNKPQIDIEAGRKIERRPALSSPRRKPGSRQHVTFSKVWIPACAGVRKEDEHATANGNEFCGMLLDLELQRPPKAVARLLTMTSLKLECFT